MISINGNEISESMIARELQYHPAESLAEAAQAATQALLIREALRAQCVAKELCAVAPEDPVAEEELFERLLALEVAVPAPDTETCQRYYRNNPERFSRPGLMECAHILLAADKTDGAAYEQAQVQAQTLLAQVQAQPQKFAEFAASHSACPSKTSGGHLGQLTPGSTVPEFEQQLQALEPGLATRPLGSRYGWHIVRMDMKLPSELLPFDMVHERIKIHLEEQARRMGTAHYLHRLLAAQKIEGFQIQ